MNTIEQALEKALQTATAMEKPAPLIPDDEVAKCIERMGLKGYIPSPQIVEPIQAFLSNFGILLSGPTGAGKTWLMELLGQRIVETTQIAEYGLKQLYIWFDFTDGYEVCIDDLGAETVVSEYGVKEDLMKQVIAHRCERQPSRTCFTTNLTADEIAARYGDRTLSRLLGMCKPFKLEGESKRTPKPFAKPGGQESNSENVER